MDYHCRLGRRRTLMSAARPSKSARMLSCSLLNLSRTWGRSDSRLWTCGCNCRINDMGIVEEPSRVQRFRTAHRQVPQLNSSFSSLLLRDRRGQGNIYLPPRTWTQTMFLHSYMSSSMEIRNSPDLTTQWGERCTTKCNLTACLD
jgi:hypothetical protein